MTEPSPKPAATAAPTDDALVARARGGDLAAFEQLMRRYNRRLYRVARSLLHDPAAAEDAVQEAWIKAYYRLDRYRAPHRFAAWLSRVAYREALMQQRRGRRLRLVEPVTLEALSEPDQEAAMPDSDPQRQTANAQLRRLLETGVDRLPEAFRGVFVLRAVEQLSVAETAAVLEIPEATVKTRYHRARALLRAHLQDQVAPLTVELFGFDGARCDRMVANVLRRLRGD